MNITPNILTASPQFATLSAGLMRIAQSHGPAVKSDILNLLKSIEEAPAAPLTGVAAFDGRFQPRSGRTRPAPPLIECSAVDVEVATS